MRIQVIGPDTLELRADAAPQPGCARQDRHRAADQQGVPERVSVVIPCFNYGHHLAEAVTSVLAQTLPGVELIIVDDGSTDRSRAVAQQLIDEHPSARIRLVCQPNSGSPGAARNAGVTQAGADYIVCLDADDRLDPDYLRACAAALDANPRAAIAYGDIQLFGDASDLAQPPPWNSRTELDCNFLGVASMFRRQTWEQVGGYDTELGYEDWDFWIGCIEQGWIGVKAPGALWHYRAHGSGVYSGHVRDDLAIKARIVCKHPALYTAAQQHWAAGVLAGDPQAHAVPGAPGAIPTFPATAAGVPAAPGPALAVRSVCLITKDFPPLVPGGIPRAVHMQAHALAAAGVDVHVITRSAQGGEGVRHDAGVTVHEIAEPSLGVPPGLGYLEIPLWSYVAAAKFAQLDAAVGFDVVETPDYRGEALHLSLRPQTALVVWLHSTMMVVWNCEPGYVRTPADDAWHALEMAALQRADLLLAPSQLLLDTTTEFLGERMRPAQLMPYLFDPDQFPAAARTRGDGPIRVLFYGRLEARKNPELAMRAVAQARVRGVDVELTLLGRNNENYRERVLEPLQAQLGLGDIRYLPHADADTLREVLAQTDVAILASRFDNSPLTIFEALSSGVPVITSDRVGTASWIGPENGLLTLPIDDPTRFAARAADAITDAQWMATGPRAARRMREMFSPEVVTGRLLDCYGQLMADRPRTPIAPPAPTSPPAIAPRPAIEGARSVAVVAFADELVADASLLSAWAGSFDAGDDITLVLYAPGWSAERAQALLLPLVTEAGLDGEDAADLLALAVAPSVALEAQLATGATAMLSRREAPARFAALPRLDERSLGALRAQLDACAGPAARRAA